MDGDALMAVKSGFYSDDEKRDAALSRMLATPKPDKAKAPTGAAKALKPRNRRASPSKRGTSGSSASES